MLWSKKEEEEDKLPDLPFQSRQIKNNQGSQMIEDTSSEEEHFESIKTAEKQALPSFPDSPIKKGFSQAAIKEAVSSEENEKIPLPPAEEELNNLSNAIKIQKQEIQPVSNSVKNVFIQPNPFLNEAMVEEKKVEPPAVTRMKQESKPIKMISVEKEYPADAPHPPTLGKNHTVPKIERPMIQPLPKVVDFQRQEDSTDTRQYFKSEERPQKEEEKTTDVFVKIDKFYAAKKALSAIKQDVKEIESLIAKIRETKMKEERELSDWEKNILSVKNELGNINDSLFEKSI